MQTTAPPVPTPRRSRRRWYAIVGFLALLVATPFGMMFVSEWLQARELEQIYAEIDAEDPNWRWAELVANQPKPPPDERNVAVQVAKVAKMRGATAILGKWHDSMKVHPNARLPEGCVDAIHKMIDRSDPAKVAEARRLKDMQEGCPRIPDSEVPWEKVGRLFLESVDVMRLLQYDACLRSSERDLEGAVESCLAILNTAHAIGDCPALMPQLVRIAGQSMAAASLERTLGQGEISESRLHALQAALAIEAEHNGLYHALRGERAGVHQFFLLERAGKISLFRDAKKTGGMKGRILEMFPSLYLRGYPETLRLQNGMIRASQLPERDRPEALGVLEEQAQKVHEQSGFLGNPWDNRFVFGAAKDMQKDQVRLRCAVVAVAVERYRFKYQVWPSGFDDLMKTGFLKTAYTDPYDGQPLRLQRTAENCIIYSVGPTKVDDGGKLTSVGTRPDGLGFVLWIPSLRGLPAPAK